MLFKIDGYEIDIKAHKDYKIRNNKRDTLDFLNWISMLAGEASKRYKSDCYDYLAKNAKKTSDDIFQQLKNLGVYGEDPKMSEDVR